MAVFNSIALGGGGAEIKHTYVIPTSVATSIRYSSITTEPTWWVVVGGSSSTTRKMIYADSDGVARYQSSTSSSSNVQTVASTCTVTVNSNGMTIAEVNGRGRFAAYCTYFLYYIE